MFVKIFLLVLLGSALSDAQEFCEINADSYMAFQYADYLIVKTTTNSTDRFYALMSDGNFTDFTDYSSDDFYGFTPDQLGAVLTFNYESNECLNQTVCTDVWKASQMVIVQLKNAFDYKTFQLRVNQTIGLTPVWVENESEMPWNWKPNGTDINKSGIFPQFPPKMKTYQVAIFSHITNNMYVVMRGSDESEYAVHSRDLNGNGIWNNWIDLASSVAINGLFILDDKMYGIILGKEVVEFSPKLKINGRYGTVKEFFNCSSFGRTTTESESVNTNNITSITSEASKPGDTKETEDNGNSGSTNEMGDSTTLKSETEPTNPASKITPDDSRSPDKTSDDYIDGNTNPESTEPWAGKDTATPTSGSQSFWGSTMFWIIFIIILLAIIGSIVFYLVNRQKNEPKPDIQIQNQDKPKTETDLSRLDTY